MSAKHTILGGKVHVYRREEFDLWQCLACMSGKKHRVSTKEMVCLALKTSQKTGILSCWIKNGTAPLAMIAHLMMLPRKSCKSMRFLQMAREMGVGYKTITVASECTLLLTSEI